MIGKKRGEFAAFLCWPKVIEIFSFCENSKKSKARPTKNRQAKKKQEPLQHILILKKRSPVVKSFVWNIIKMACQIVK
jgi:hypothetical protein